MGREVGCGRSVMRRDGPRRSRAATLAEASVHGDGCRNGSRGWSNRRTGRRRDHRRKQSRAGSLVRLNFMSGPTCMPEGVHTGKASNPTPSSRDSGETLHGGARRAACAQFGWMDSIWKEAERPSDAAQEAAAMAVFARAEKQK
ncbi:hypothetical protein PR202_gb27528 [Eleusine coracana subsp. coracana]|uniref:Uncharacterized protein n=1 Tax=Eleusine coracana subsp. coracana TaxID=191504 RepID=A0AAV5FUP8_ELECO|nr:hypothetical protein PR202_gb27528 [Eleusine coracana subsp. coracana]